MTSISLSSQSPYLIAVGEADARRAASLQLTFDPFSLNFFPFDKIRNGDHILFAGCGNGKLEVQIAREIKNWGFNVHIVAFDISIKQLDCARAYAKNQGIEDINWTQQDVNDLSQFAGKFNIVHTRFLLNHLPQANAVTKDLAKALTLGGFFVGEELSGFEVDVSPNKPEYVEAIKAWKQGSFILHAQQGSDITFAKRLPHIFSKINMTITKQQSPDIVASTPEQKDQLPAGSNIGPVFLSTYFHAGIEPLIKKLEEMRDAEDCSITFKHFTQIVAEKSSINSTNRPKNSQLILQLA